MDSRARTGHRLFIDLRALERSGVHAGHHGRDLVERSHVFQLGKLIVEVGKGEFIALEFLFKFGSLLCIERSLCLFNQREHIAHAENA